MNNTVKGWIGTIADLRKWLEQFEDTDTVTFDAGEEDGGAFMVVFVNGNEVAEW